MDTMREGPIWASPTSWAMAYILAMPVILPHGILPLGALEGKVQVAEVIFLGWLACTLWLATDRYELLAPPLWGLFAAYGVTVFLSALMAKRWWPGPMVEVVSTWYGICLAFLVFQVAREEKGLHRLLRCWVMVATAVAALGLVGLALAWGGLPTPFVREYPNLRWNSWRLTSTVPLPNMAYAYLHWSWFLAIALLFAQEPGRGRLKNWLWVGLIGLAMVGTMSRGIVAAGVGLWCLLWQWPKLKKTRWTVGIFVATLFVYSQLFATWVYDLRFDVKTGTATERLAGAEVTPPGANIFSAQHLYPEGTSFNLISLEATYLPSRYLVLKRLAWRMFRLHPLLGVGPGNFSDSAKEVWRPDDPAQQWKIVAAADPHSTYFGALSELGMIGLLAVLSLFVGMVVALLRVVRGSGFTPIRKQLAWAGIAGIAGYLVFAVNVDIMSFRFLWVILGVLAAVIEQRPNILGAEVEIEAIHYSGKERKGVRHLD